MRGYVRLKYTSKFKEIVRSNPGLIRKFMKHKNDALPYVDGSISIAKFDPGTRLVDGKQKKNGEMHKNLWTVEAGGRKLFVKETLIGEYSLQLHATGCRQYKLTQKLAFLAKLMPKPIRERIGVLPCHMGADYWGTSFLVMDFSPHHRLPDSQLDKRMGKKFYRFSQFAELFAGAWDLYNNSFYDRENGKILINDPAKIHDIFPIRAVRYTGIVLRYPFKLLIRKLFPAAKEEPGFQKAQAA
jgi:hypothetical protein